MPKIYENPADKKVYGIGIRQRILDKSIQSGFTDFNDFIDNLLILLNKKDNVIRAMQDELNKIPSNATEPAIPISEIDKVKQLLQAKPEE